MRIWLLLHLFFATWMISDHAYAGDFAEREILGFNQDGTRFGFIEYGRQDGSGFPYANIYVIDTATDTWTDGSPFRVMLEDETATVGQARQQATEAAAGSILQLTEPGTIVASNRPLEIVAEPMRIVAQPRFFQVSSPDLVEYRISTEPLLGPDYCQGFGQTRGFTLSQMFEQAGEATRILHEDTALPESRGCPLGYRFADLITYFPEGGEPVIAILILMERVGFEGPDGRFLAVTAPLVY